MRHFKFFFSAVFLILLFGCNNNNNVNVNSSVLDDIIKNDTIRCGYLLYPPYFMRDPNTGIKSGIFYDIMEAIGKNSNLKIDWADNETGYENIFTDLDNNKYEVFAGGLWPNSTRAKVGAFSIPVFYSVIKTWGRANETRFLNNLKEINSPDIKIATIDGAMEDIIAKNDFPNATKVSLTQLSPFTQNLQNIISNKADVTFAEPGIIYEFLSKNPGTLKELAPDDPVRIFGNCLVVKKKEYDLQEFLDIALKELLYSGEIDRILKKYESNTNVFLRVAKPYKVEANENIPFFNTVSK